MPLFRFIAPTPTVLTGYNVRYRVTSNWSIDHYRTRRYNAKDILTGYATIYELFTYDMVRVPQLARLGRQRYEIDVQAEAAVLAPYTLSVATYTHHNIPEEAPEGYTEVARTTIPLVPNDATRIYINLETYSMVVRTNTWREALARHVGTRFIQLLLSRVMMLSEAQRAILEADDETEIIALYESLSEQLATIVQTAQQEEITRRENEERALAASREQEYLENIKNLFRSDEKELKERIERALNTVSVSKARLETALTQLEDARKEYYAEIVLSDANNTAAQNLIQFIDQCDWIRVTSCEGSNLEVLITTKMEYWDKQTAERYLGRRNSKWIDVLKKIFISEEYELLISNIIGVSASSFRTTDVSKSRSALIPNMHNPHHAEYNCWGQYSATMAELTRAHRYEELFMTIRTALAGINFADGAVISKLLSYDTITKPCIYIKETAELLTPAEAIARE